MNTKDKKRIQAIVEAKGYHIEINQWPRKLTYYNRQGKPLPNMPADPWSMERNLRKGFTLTPPVQPSNGDNGLRCECGFEAKSDFGLKVHERKHERELVKGEKDNA